MNLVDELVVVRRSDQFSPTRNDHVVATATCCCCCCCCCCAATMLLTGISMEKQFTQSLVAISPEGTSGASVARSYRGARWLVGGAPFAGFLAAFVIVQVLNSSPNHRVHAFGWLGLAVLPLGVLAAVRAAYASAHLKAPPLAVRLLVYVLLFLLEAAISFATFGLFGIGAAIVGLVVFAGRAFTPPKTPLGPHRWSPPET